MDERKFGELVLYIAKKSEDDPRFGNTKLNKILYYSDFAAYRRLGRSITGDVYQNLPNGPAPRHLLAVFATLERSGAIDHERRSVGPYIQKRVVAKRPPDESVLTEEELRIVDEVLDALWLMSAGDVTQLSHQEFGWMATEASEDIPYYTAWVGSAAEPLTDEQIRLGQQVAERHGFRERSTVS
jgi:uncharacterized phage-associated protein